MNKYAYLTYLINASVEKLCFLCENDQAERSIDDLHQCSMCSPPAYLDRTKGQKILGHMAAHILFDNTIVRSDQPCGMCLRPAPVCAFYLKKTKGAQTWQVDEAKSTCSSHVSFNYTSASKSSSTAPSSNVPVLCKICSMGSANPFSKPAIWKYNLKAHILSVHPNANVMAHKDDWDIDDEELVRLKEVWKKRHEKKRGKVSKGLAISEAHSSRMAARCVFKKNYIN